MELTDEHLDALQECLDVCENEGIPDSLPEAQEAMRIIETAHSGGVIIMDAVQ